jgi:hypothetical protein
MLGTPYPQEDLLGKHEPDVEYVVFCDRWAIEGTWPCWSDIRGAVNFSFWSRVEGDISSRQARQASVVAAHIAHAAHTVNEAGTREEIGVTIRGQGDRYCGGGREILRRGARVCTRSGDTAGGCKMVWKLQLKAARYALAYVMAACNGDKLRKDAVYLHLWYTCGRIVTMECEAHCWESMKCPAKVICDAPRGAARQRGGLLVRYLVYFARLALDVEKNWQSGRRCLHWHLATFSPMSMLDDVVGGLLVSVFLHLPPSMQEVEFNQTVRRRLPPMALGILAMISMRGQKPF